MSQQKHKYSTTLRKYIPEEYCDYVATLLVENPVRFKISKPRKTKLGDFKFNTQGLHQITVNGNLNKYSFLVTTLHEFAHLTTFTKHGNKVAPHGIEWKNEFRRLLDPVFEINALPNDLSIALGNYFHRMKASSCTDLNLYRALSKYDKTDSSQIHLENLEMNDKFALNNRTFIKGKLRRTRFLCTDTTNKRTYLISALAKVNKINE